MNLIDTEIKESPSHGRIDPDPNRNLDCLLEDIILPEKKSHSRLLPPPATIDS